PNLVPENSPRAIWNRREQSEAKRPIVHDWTTGDKPPWSEVTFSSPSGAADRFYCLCAVPYTLILTDTIFDFYPRIYSPYNIVSVDVRILSWHSTSISD